MSRDIVHEININDIFIDNGFNCRGYIDATQCIELAKDIKENGLLSPIIIQPYSGNPKYKYRAINGHRRLTAYRINASVDPTIKTIKAFIYEGLTDDEARDINLRENIQRTDLSFLQEALTLEKMFKERYTNQEVGQKVGKSVTWVDQRRKLLHLPRDVQELADKGVIKTQHIFELFNHRNSPEKFNKMVLDIKNRAERGEKNITIKKDLTIDTFVKAKKPIPQELEDFKKWMFEHLVSKVPQEEYFPARLLAWLAGTVPLANFWLSVRRECERYNLPFCPPPEIETMLNQLKEIQAKNV
jgi:ParB family chromosome partitioning protein